MQSKEGSFAGNIKIAAAMISVIVFVCVNSFGQTLEQIENELVGHLVEIKKNSNYGETADYDILARENQALQDALVKYGSRPDVLTYAFPKLTEKMNVTTSPDGKFRAYSWDTEEGGTMHDFCSVYQYRGSKGKAHTWFVPYSQSMEDRGAGAFVHQIFQTNSKSGPIYLTVSTWIGSTTLSGQSLEAFKINGERLDTKAKVIRTRKGLTNSVGFQYDFFSVVDHPERPIRLFNYDEAKRTFSFPVVVEDAETPQGRVTKRSITYRFNGKHFVRS